jgi:hypothetical protein
MRMFVRRTSIALSALAACLALSCSPASAAVTHEYLSQITEVPATGPHGEAVALPGPLSEVDSLAADSGGVWLAEHIGGTVNFRVDEFNAESGAFLSQLPQVAGVEELRHGIAVGHATGEAQIYVVGEESGEGVVLVFDAAGHLLGKWTGADTHSTAFGCVLCGGDAPRVAVDNSTSLGDWAAGDVYVSDTPNDVVDVFRPESGGKEKLVTELTGASAGKPFKGPAGIAASGFNGDLLVLDEGEVDMFAPGAISGQYEFMGNLSGPEGPFGEVRSMGIDGSDGNIFIAEPNVIYELNSAGTYLGRITGERDPAKGFQSVQSVAVDSATHHVFVSDYRGNNGNAIDVFGPDQLTPDVTTEGTAGVGYDSAVLLGAVDPDSQGEALCQFVWGTSIAFGNVTSCSHPVPDGSTPVSVSTEIEGLQPDTTYHYRLQATNVNGTNFGEASQDQEFTTVGPGIHEVWSSEVEADSATLEARIDPNGSFTTYHFQYGTNTSYGHDIPVTPGDVGSGHGDVEIGQHLQGLEVSTTYHYRVVAVSELAPGQFHEFDGPDQTFLTSSLEKGSGLPDNRAWEMVSPVDKQGAAIEPITNEGGTIQASTDGGAITYVASAATEAEPQGNRNLELTQVFSKRGPGSWSSQDIDTPNRLAAPYAIGEGPEYRLFSEDLSHGYVEPRSDTPLPPLPEDAEKTIYLRNDTDGAFEALVTAANTRVDAKFGFGEAGFRNLEFEGASPDLAHVVFRSFAALTPNAVEAENEQSLYEWTGGQLQLVSLLPNHRPAVAEGVKGSLGAQGFVVKHAVSNDGSRVVWEGQPNIYLTEPGREETTQIDTAQGTGEQDERGTFSTASSDDSRIFFTSASRLTVDSTARQGGEPNPDLYEFEVTSAKNQPLSGKLTDLTVDRNPEEKADVLFVIGASEDGTSIYFAASGLLGDAAEHGGGAGSPNLYVERYDSGAKAWSTPKFIAMLSSADVALIAARPNGLENMTSRVSPDGRYLAFMSSRSLTGYDNSDANSGEQDEEVFLYDSDTGHVSCASCDPTGARPSGTLDAGAYPGLLGDSNAIWGGHWLASLIPGWTPIDGARAIYQSRYLSDSGRLFFDSNEALVPGDTNGTWDVYEYESPGVGDCTVRSVTFSASSGGCVGLISSGGSAEESSFLDASENGDDVFFLTTAGLVPQDGDGLFDVYDAHSCSASVPCPAASVVAPPPCSTGDSCKPAASPQPENFGAPASQTFSGVGNVAPSAVKPVAQLRSLTRAQKLSRARKACLRKPKRKRPSCERQARKRYARKAVKKSARVKKSTTTKGLPKRAGR